MIGTRFETKNHLVRERSLNHLANLAKWLNFVVKTCLYDVYDCMLCHVSYEFKSESKFRVNHNPCPKTRMSHDSNIQYSRIVRKTFVCYLKASIFHSSILIKMLKEKKKFIYIFYYEARIKSRGFQKINWGKPKVITKFPHFLKGNPAEHQYLTIFNC